jgi:hypothetical protein
VTPAWIVPVAVVALLVVVVVEVALTLPFPAPETEVVCAGMYGCGAPSSQVWAAGLVLLAGAASLLTYRTLRADGPVT